MKQAKQFLGKAVEHPEVLRAGRAKKVLRSWKSIVGTELALRSWPERYDRGVLWVAVTGSAWAQELRMAQESILQRLNEQAGEPGLFASIRFGVRALNQAVVDLPLDEDVTNDKDENLSISDIAKRRLANWPRSSGD
jgi:predicted nucleic acid-binding Zn ribbon protein